MSKNDDDIKRAQLRKDLEDYNKSLKDEETKKSLEIIGNSILSGLSSITNLSAQALEIAVEKTKAANKKSLSSDADKIKERIALRKKQDILKVYKKAEIKQRRKKNNMKFNVSFIIFFLSFLVFNYLVNFAPLVSGLISGVIALSGGFFTGKVYNPKKEIPGISTKDIEYTNNYMKMMKEANEDLDKIYFCVENAKDEEIKENATKLYERGLQILEYIQSHPQKLMKASRFLTYYLETASNICAKYIHYCDAPFKCEGSDDVSENAKRAMILLEQAFDKEFSKLLEEDIIDLETDVKVLENSMKWDNYMD